MTLTTLNDNQPEWVKPELGLEEYKEFKLGQKVKYFNDWVYIIHIQKNEETNDVFFRGMLSNGASITMLYELINKPVETTNEQPKYDLDKWFEDLKNGTVFEKPIGKHFGTKLKTKVIQLEGVEIVLFEDGTYSLSDTSGG